MSNWPSSPLIRITAGSLREVPLHGALAASEGLAASGSPLKYQIIQGPGAGSLIRRDDPDSGSILAWEDVIPVPAADLENLRTEFRGAAISERRLASLLRVTSTLMKPLAQSPLDRAVTAVEKLLEGPRTLLDTSSERYLARLLDALAAFQGVEYGPRPQVARALATIVCICIRWIVEIAPPGSQFFEHGESGVLAEVRALVEFDPAVGGFPVMVALAGDSATLIDEARETGEGLADDLIEPVLAIGHYALALLAKSLEGGE